MRANVRMGKSASYAPAMTFELQSKVGTPEMVSEVTTGLLEGKNGLLGYSTEGQSER